MSRVSVSMYICNGKHDGNSGGITDTDIIKKAALVDADTPQLDPWNTDEADVTSTDLGFSVSTSM